MIENTKIENNNNNKKILVFILTVCSFAALLALIFVRTEFSIFLSATGMLLVAITSYVFFTSPLIMVQSEIQYVERESYIENPDTETSTVEKDSEPDNSLKQVAQTQLLTDQDSSLIDECFADILNGMEEARRLAILSGDKVLESHHNIDVTKVSLEALNSKLKSVKDVFEHLSSSSSGINAIVMNIQDIAKQTNLLALNASIEAARAGVHGRGFAVVASEVRELANRSTSSSEKIATITKELQKTSTDAGEGIEELVSSCEDCQSHSAKALIAMNHIKAGSEERKLIVASINQKISELKQQIGKYGLS
ncbi:MAG: chemotaxis protein [Alteromonadaceae bacterium]|nr:chemotaxis protein [Alteromonadaceae bacterium]|tara:strand:+ start:773 stop:1699 length:927 start_codon:yes stop_codon:yes gene_type:complete